MAKKTKRLPKKIAGVKIPKELRKAGGKAVTLAARHPVISDIVAAGLLAAAAALTDDKKMQAAAARLGEEAEEAGRKAGRARNAVKAAAGAIGQALLDELGDGKAAKRRPAPGTD